jgi:hypothetical protein
VVLVLLKEPDEELVITDEFDFKELCEDAENVLILTLLLPMKLSKLLSV